MDVLLAFFTYLTMFTLSCLASLLGMYILFKFYDYLDRK
jgi:hypothetical protein